MIDFSGYYQPHSLPDALELLATLPPGYRLLAGGTDVVPALRSGELKVEGLIDLSRIADLRGIEQIGDRIRIGCLTTFNQVARSETLRHHAAVLAEAASVVGSPQIRNLGTIGGNIINASPAADTVPALVALEAEVKLCSRRQERFLKVDQLLCGAGKTNLLPGELAHSVYFDIPPSNTRSGFVKLGRRNALAIARLSAAAVITLDDSWNKIIRARVALGAVAPNPFRSEELENLLTGAEIFPELIDEAAAMASAVVAARLGARPSAPYKREAVKGVIRVLLERLLLPVGVPLEGGCIGP